MKGVVAAGGELSAQAGAAMFRAGGNAVDAAVATAFAAFVAEACVVNIGAAGFAVLVEPDAGSTEGYRSQVYDFCTVTPSAKTDASDFHEVWIDFGGEKQPFFIGRGSTAVPGAVAGLCRMAADHGKLPLSVILEPAITLAREGFTITPYLEHVLELLGPIHLDTPEIRQIFMTEGRLYRAGEHFAMPPLANTLQQLAEEGPDLFYRGRVAEAIVADQEAHGGLIGKNDMAAYRVLVKPPLRVSYRGHEVLLPPPASHGGVLIGFALKLLETVNLKHQIHGTFPHLKVLAHVMCQTSHARRTWERLWETANLSEEERVIAFLGPEHFEPYAVRLRNLIENGGTHGETSDFPAGPGNTSHISAMDSAGNAVSITLSAGEGAGYVVGDTGVFLNNMLGEHDLHPRGFHRDPAGMRLRSMMSPAVVLRKGKPVMAVGSAGSNRLRSAILQTISNTLDFGMSPEEGINAARIHFEAGVLQIEAGNREDVAKQLEAEGFRINLWKRKSLFFGGAQAVTSFNGKLEGGGDQRRAGAVAVG